MPFKIVNYSNLKSNNESIQVYFGKLTQGNNSGNWLALSENERLKEFTTIDYTFEPENEKENEFDIKFNNSKNRISLRISDLDTVKNKVTYSWLNKMELSDSLIVQNLKTPLAKGEYFKNLPLTNINGEAININNYENSVVVLNWWAVWCTPCRKEIPGLNKLVNKFSDKNIKFISVTNDSKGKVNHFLNESQFDYEITFVNKENQMIFGNSYPKNIIIDTSGKIIYYSEGANENTPKEIERQLV